MSKCSCHVVIVTVEHVTKKTEIPFWAETGNFPTLLNLAYQRKQHGPMRWYWEGTSERYIQQLKKHLVSMRKNDGVFYGEINIDA